MSTPIKQTLESEQEVNAPPVAASFKSSFQHLLPHRSFVVSKYFVLQYIWTMLTQRDWEIKYMWNDWRFDTRDVTGGTWQVVKSCLLFSQVFWKKWAVCYSAVGVFTPTMPAIAEEGAPGEEEQPPLSCSPVGPEPSLPAAPTEGAEERAEEEAAARPQHTSAEPPLDQFRIRKFFVLRVNTSTVWSCWWNETSFRNVPSRAADMKNITKAKQRRDILYRS